MAINTLILISIFMYSYSKCYSECNNVDFIIIIFILQFPTSMFESKTSRHMWVAPASSADSDMECDDGEDGDDTVLEPDFHLNVDEQEIIPSRTRKCKDLFSLPFR